jgi:transcriptional regulator with XRE-family HTH domain
MMETEVEGLQERLKTIRKTMKLTQQQFAERIGVSRDVVASWEIGRVQPSEAMLRLISRECAAGYEWLKYGTGVMEANRETTEMEKLAKILEGDNAFMKAFLQGLIELPKEAWEMMEAFMRNLQHEPNP